MYGIRRRAVILAFVDLAFLMPAFVFFAGTMGSVDAGLLQPVSSARTLNGEELLRIGEIHDVQNHFPEALTYYRQSLASFRAQKHRRGEAAALTKIGAMFERQGRRDEAAVYLHDAVTLFAKFPGSPIHADALFALGRVSLWQGSREEAVRLFERALDQYSRLHNAQAVALVKIQLGLLKVSGEQTREGLELIEQALEDARRRHDGGQEIAALLALGDANWIMDDLEAAGISYQQSLALIEQRPHATTEAGLRYRLAAIWDVTGHPEQGIGAAKRAITLYQSVRDLSGEAASWALLASLRHRKGEDQEAEDAGQHALSLYRQRQVVVHAASSSGRK